MSRKKYIVANFTDEAVLFPAVKKVKDAGYKIHDVFTPYPVHGLDHELGLKETSLHTAGFIYGITGTCTALGFITWALTSDWPLNFGGKPFFSLLAWIPITFELTVLFAAVGMTFTFLWLCQLAPGVKKDHFNLRNTDDTFTMAIECADNTNEHDALNLLNGAGAMDVSVQEKENRWWWGRYDKK